MAQFIYKGVSLIQKHIGVYTCEGCFFHPYVVNKGTENLNDKTKQYPCCERVDDKFIFPCSKDIIYVKEEDNRNT
jgi:hypothetical protein